MQFNLLNIEPLSEPEIVGLSYIRNFITPEKAEELVKLIDYQPWLYDLKRRVQHYGWKYDYTARKVTTDLKIGNLPSWLQELAENLYQKNIFEKLPDQIIINEYQAGQGISAHIDCVPCFGDTIASLSLCSPCVMDFINPSTAQKDSKLLEPLSLLVMKEDARYKLQHTIPARKTDKINGQIFTRSRRISLTFRNVIVG